MKKSRVYHIFLFLSTFTRGLVEVFSLVLLYKKGFTVANIFFFLFVMYTVGILVNYISLRISYKIVLIVSSLLYGISFLYLSFMSKSLWSLVWLAILLASSNYSYHAIRHLLSFKLLDNNKNSVNLIVVVTYLGVMASSLIGIYLIDRLSLVITSIIVFLLSFVAIIPVLKMKDESKLDVSFFSRRKLSEVKLGKRKIFFSILEQFKVLFLEIQPLFLYLYVEQSIYYVGIFNVIVNFASLIVMYFIARKMKLSYFKYFCFGLGIVFLLKLNIKSGLVLLGLAFLEGIFVKIYENVSLGNLYDIENNFIENYLILEEFIFFISKSIVMLLVCLLGLNIYVVMYFCILGLILSGFFIG